MSGPIEWNNAAEFRRVLPDAAVHLGPRELHGVPVDRGDTGVMIEKPAGQRDILGRSLIALAVLPDFLLIAYGLVHLDRFGSISVGGRLFWMALPVALILECKLFMVIWRHRRNRRSS